MKSLAYVVQVLVLMVVVYPALLLLVLWIAPPGASMPTRYAVSVLPALPVVGVALVLLRWLRQADELERRIQLDALAFSGIVTMLGGGAYVMLTGLPAYVLVTAFFLLWAVAVAVRRMWLGRGGE
ncbi:hypothetical protein [Fodinicola acaciae]|uniref:hypothetical protein n=1 Tax=Fodinicola acaciae TaxID=2681555 RepID=UPI0013D407ED|nr:hypothetical protein [Fodinicola acaciae]